MGRTALPEEMCGIGRMYSKAGSFSQEKLPAW